MLGVDAKHQIVANPDLIAEHPASPGKRKDHVVLAAAGIDRYALCREIAGSIGWPDRNPVKNKRRDFRLALAQFAPGDLAVAVRVNGVSKIEIANGEFELPGDPAICYVHAQKPVALRVGIGQSCRQKDGEENSSCE